MQNGILKRVRATPLPAWAYFGGLLAHCMLVSVVDVLAARSARSARGNQPIFRNCCGTYCTAAALAVTIHMDGEEMVRSW